MAIPIRTARLSRIRRSRSCVNSYFLSLTTAITPKTWSPQQIGAAIPDCAFEFRGIPGTVHLIIHRPNPRLSDGTRLRSPPIGFFLTSRPGVFACSFGLRLSFVLTSHRPKPDFGLRRWLLSSSFGLRHDKSFRLRRICDLTSRRGLQQLFLSRTINDGGIVDCW